jgi:hypothetical protein
MSRPAFRVEISLPGAAAHVTVCCASNGVGRLSVADFSQRKTAPPWIRAGAVFNEMGS